MSHKKSGKGVFKAIFLMLAWLVIFSLAKDVVHVQNGFDRVREAKLRLENEELKNITLLSKLEAVRTETYKEELIRDQLNMQKEGEVVVVLPKRLETKEDAKNEGLKEIPNWKKWCGLVY